MNHRRNQCLSSGISVPGIMRSTNYRRVCITANTLKQSALKSMELWCLALIAAMPPGIK